MCDLSWIQHVLPYIFSGLVGAFIVCVVFLFYEATKP